MNPRILHNSMIVAARHSPTCRHATLWQIAKDDAGNEIMANGVYTWKRLCTAYVVFDYGKADVWAGATGEYGNDFKLTVIPEPISRAPWTLPDLGDTFMVRRFEKFPGDPTPAVALAITRTGGDSAGLSQSFIGQEPEKADVPDVILNDQEPLPDAPF